METAANILLIIAGILLAVAAFSSYKLHARSNRTNSSDISNRDNSSDRPRLVSNPTELRRHRDLDRRNSSHRHQPGDHRTSIDLEQHVLPNEYP